jgi:MoaA/NifB/PqqE/SkfB family radical SAM enzyme
MALRSLNFAVDDYCNFRCVMCHIWKNARRDPLDAKSIAAAFADQRSKLDQVEELSITGGEVFLREDLGAIVDAAIHGLPALQRLFVNTNGSFADRTICFARTFVRRVSTLFICISIDGEKRFHDRVRGIESYDACVDLVRRLKELGMPNLRVVVSTTLVDANHAVASLRHVRALADQFGCELTFRLADASDVYYRNGGFRARLTPEAIQGVCAFIDRYYSDQPYFAALKAVLLGQSNPVMLDSEGKLHCRAGERFVFIQADGRIRPCIFSHRVLGTLGDGLATTRIDDLGKYEPCPCCTECTIYPMLTAAERPLANRAVASDATMRAVP